MEPLLINFFLYFFLILYFLKYKRNNTVIIYLTTVYAFVALIAYFINDTDYYTWGQHYIGKNIMLRQPATMSPLLYIFIGYIIFIQPISSCSNEGVKSIAPVSLRMLNYLYVICLAIFLFYIFLELRNAMAIDDYYEAYMSLQEGERKATLGVNIGLICTGLQPLAFVLSFYFLTEDVGMYRKGTTLLIAIVIVRYITAIIDGSRGVLFFVVFNVIFGYILFRHLLAKSVRTWVVRILIAIFCLFALLAIGISISRFDTRMMNSIASYFGESFINFSRIFWDDPTSEPLYGQYTFGRILKIDIDEINTNYPLLLFKTFAGCAYVDFGTIGGMIFLVLQSLFWKTWVGKVGETVTLHQMMIYHYVVMMVLTGAFGMAYSGWSAYAILVLSYAYLRMSKITS